MTQYCGGGMVCGPEWPPKSQKSHVLNKNLLQTITSNAPVCIPIIGYISPYKKIFANSFTILNVLIYDNYKVFLLLHVYILNLDLNIQIKNIFSYKTLPSRTSCDTENVAEKIIHNMIPKQLIEVACNAFHQGQQLLSKSSYRSFSPSVYVSIILSLYVSVAVSFCLYFTLFDNISLSL